MVQFSEFGIDYWLINTYKYVPTLNMFENQSLKLYEQSPDSFSLELHSDIYYQFQFSFLIVYFFIQWKNICVCKRNILYFKIYLKIDVG